MNLIDALHRLAVVASCRPTPAELARALGGQVLQDFGVTYVHVMRLDSHGQWTQAATFGAASSQGCPLSGQGRAKSRCLSMLGSRPRLCVNSERGHDIDAQRGERTSEHTVCMPLLSRGLLVGSMVIAMEADPELDRNAAFWDTLAIGCAILIASGSNKQFPYAKDERPSSRLSARQQQILSLVAEGLTNQQIGHRLGYSESTIGHDLVTAYACLGVRNREDAVRAWLRTVDTDDRPRSGAVA